MADIVKPGLLVIRDGGFLLCRKARGTHLLILPGGKYEPGETAGDCLDRECREEFGVGVVVGSLQFLGTFEAAAAGQESRTVRIELYSGTLNGEPAAQSEIAELVWFDAQSDRGLLSPVLRDHIVPDLISRGVLRW